MEVGALHGWTYRRGDAEGEGSAWGEECSVRNAVLIRWNQSVFQGSNYDTDLYNASWPPIRLPERKEFIQVVSGGRSNMLRLFAGDKIQ